MNIRMRMPSSLARRCGNDVAHCVFAFFSSLAVNNVVVKDMFFIQISQTIYLLNFGVICLTALHIPSLPDCVLRVKCKMSSGSSEPLADTG